MSQDLISTIIRSKRRTLSIEIRSDAVLIIRAPIRSSMESIIQCVEKKRSWILEKQQKAKENYKPHTKYEFIDGEEFLYLGVPYKLRIVPDAKKSFEFNGEEFIMPSKFFDHSKRSFQEWYMKQAAEKIAPRVAYFANKAGVEYSRITITSAKTRWGSCTSKKMLNFSWRLMMAPWDMIDYVVAHEVAHLQELNHSSRFWKKVESLIPDYRVRELWFKNNQHLLSF